MSDSQMFVAVAVYDRLSTQFHEVRLYKHTNVPFVEAEFKRSLSNPDCPYSQTPKDYVLCDVSACVKKFAGPPASIGFDLDYDSSLVVDLVDGAQLELSVE